MANSRGCKLSVKRLLKSFDQFGVQMNFRVGNDSHHRSVFGGVIFAMYSIALILFVYSGFYSYINMENVSLIYTNKVVTSPKANLTKLKFGFAFGLALSNGSSVTELFADYLTFEAYYISKQGFDLNNAPTPILLKNCEKKDFYFSEKKMNETLFTSFQLNTMLCPNLTSFNERLQLKGLYTENEFNYIELTVKVKDSLMSSDDLNILRQILTDIPVEANIFYNDIGLQYDNLTQPITYYINNDHKYLDIDVYNQIDYSFSTLDFSSDENIIYNDPKESFYLFFDQSKENFYTISDRLNTSNQDRSNLVTFNLKASSNYIVCVRTYEKFTQLIANLTGILSQMVLILIFVVGYVNEKGAYQKIMHRIMKFRGKKNYNHDIFVDLFNKKEKQMKEKLNEQEKGRRKAVVLSSVNFPSNLPLYQVNSNNNANHEDDSSSNSSQDCNSSKRLGENNDINDFKEIEVPISKRNNPGTFVKKNPNFTSISANKTEDKIMIELSKTNSNVISKINNNNPPTPTPTRIDYLRMNAFEILLSPIFCCNRRWKENNIIIDKGEEKVNYYLDILTYIKKMQEIEIMKYLLLTSDQLNLFNFLSAPTISIGDFNSEVHKLYEEEVKRKVIIGKEEIEKLGHSYEKVVVSEAFTPLDSKIIRLFNSDLDGLRY